MSEKDDEIIKEVLDEIDSALKDPKGIVSHQRRLAFSLSLGTVALIEDHLKKLEVFKPGAKINHLWLKKKKDNVKKFIERQIICPLEEIKNLNKIFDAAHKIEKQRNELSYGKLVSESILKEQIKLFLNLKKELEKEK